ncbi:MAG: type II methionyl aminopeptidase [Candidatus Micrarchaeaceae archaeon]
MAIGEDELRVLKEVGKASSDAMLYAADMVKPGAKLLDVAEAAEKFLRDKGFAAAFPINLSINEQAAHYTPSVGDEKVFTDKDIVKVDFGAMKDGMLGDGAITVDLSGKHQKMIEAADKALDSAIALVRHGVSVCDIGKAIFETIEPYGFRPVMNLGGHGIGVHDLHTDPFIPNYDNADFTVLETGMVVAIEPFVTTGEGMVANSSTCEIYSYVENAQVRSPDARNLLEIISKDNAKEPFAIRWLEKYLPSKFRLYAAVAELVRAEALEPHPMLIETSGGPVAQAEAQLLVTDEGCEIITRAKR